MTAAPPRIDWFRVIVDLNYAGYSNGRIAAEMLMSRNWVHELKNNGTEPRHVDGRMLIGIWSKVTGKPFGEAPTLRGHGDGSRSRARFLAISRET